MDPHLIHLIVAIVATVASGVVTAFIWKRAQVKTVFWWIGLTLLPAGIYLSGLGDATAGAVTTLYGWWIGLSFTPLQWTGLVLGALSALMIVGSRLIPSESRNDRKALPQGESAAATQSGKTPGRLAPRPATPAKPAAPATPQGPGDEFDEISELLRKRGIN